MAAAMDWTEELAERIRALAIEACEEAGLGTHAARLRSLPRVTTVAGATRLRRVVAETMEALAGNSPN